MQKNTPKLQRFYRSSLIAFLVITIFLSMLGTGQISTAKAQLFQFSIDSVTASSASIFGIEMQKVKNEYGLSEMATADAAWVRTNQVLWSQVEPVADEFHWEVLQDLDAQLDSAIANGMQPILIVRSTPTWAQKNPGYYCGPIAQNNFKDFSDFLKELVTRYKDKVKYWEIWNEPDAAITAVPSPTENYGCWGVTTDQYYGGVYYSQMLTMAYNGIKTADPDAKVIIGGLMMDCGPGGNCINTNILKFLEGILVNNGGNNFDGIAFHAYDYYQGGVANYDNKGWGTSRATTGPVELAKANYIRNLLGQYGVVDKFLMNTELAVVCTTGCDDPNNQNTKNFETTKAYYVAQAYSGAIAKKLDAAIWYGAKMGWRQSDLLYTDLTPRQPAYNAYKFGQQELYNAQYMSDITQFNGVMGFDFLRNDRRVWVLWSKDGVNHPVPMPDLPYAIYDVDGDALPLQTTVTIKLEPYYIELPMEFYMWLPTAYQNNQAILNANFERGIDGSNPREWAITKGGGPGLDAGLITSSPTIPYPDSKIPMGTASMQLGRGTYESCSYPDVPLGYAGVEQTFKVPYTPGNIPVRLTFKYITYTQDANPGLTSSYDLFEVHIKEGISDQTLFRDMNEDSSIIGTCNWVRVPSANWKTGSILLTSPIDYRGKTVTVSFQNWNRADGYYNTITYVDQVYVELGDPVP